MSNTSNMAETDEKKQVAPVDNYDSTSSFDEDNAKLAEMGYNPELKRNFSVWSMVGIGFALTNSWFGISASLVTGISSGGPIVTVYGICIITLINGCTGITLAEMASAMPNAGGQYFWANELAPEGWSDFLAYLTGALSWFGALFTCASVALSIGSILMGMIQFHNPGLVIERWHTFVAYQVFNFVAWTFNCYGRTLPRIGAFFLYCSLTSFVVITITVLAKATPKQDAKFVFANFENETGWKSGGIAFIVGLINPNWSFSCLDSATHLAEEVNKPERVIPIAIMSTLAIGFTTSFLYSISMFFSMKNLPELVNTPTLVPILELYYQALESKAGATVLITMVALTGLGCQVACHTWQARLMWSFSRDRGLPGSKYWSKVHPKLGVPVIAHTFSCFLVGLLGLLYIASYTAFNSMVTATIVLLYLSYDIPTILLLMKGRNNIKHGPFWLGKFGMVANYVMLIWSLFTLVMYSFPYVKPVKTDTMNYVSAVYAGVFLFIYAYWFARGKRTFRTRDARHQEVEQLTIAHTVTNPTAQKDGKDDGIVR